MDADRESRRVWRRNVLMTLAVFGPLGATFGLAVATGRVVNYYPVPVWNLFVEAARPSDGRVFYVVEGRGRDGAWRNLPPFGITAALYNRMHTFSHYTDGNLPFRLDSPHPQNVGRLAGAGGDADRLPEGARVPDVLRAWGEVRNGRLPADSPDRLTAIRMQARFWPGVDYHAEAKTLRTWEVGL